METYTQMMKRHQEVVDNLPIRYAFGKNGKKQYEAMLEEFGLTGKSDDYIREHITSIFGIGDYVLKKDVPMIKEVLSKNEKELNDALFGDDADDEFILDAMVTELENQEYSYTHDVRPALRCLGITDKELEKSARHRRLLKKACKIAIQNASW